MSLFVFVGLPVQFYFCSPISFSRPRVSTNNFFQLQLQYLVFGCNIEDSLSSVEEFDDIEDEYTHEVAMYEN
jgi:hypothetical protein